MSSLGWKLNRARAMGAGEIAYRVRQAAQAGIERLGFGLARPTLGSRWKWSRLVLACCPQSSMYRRIFALRTR